MTGRLKFATVLTVAAAMVASVAGAAGAACSPAAASSSPASKSAASKADFASGLPGAAAYAVKLLSGGALVADTGSIVRLDNTRTVAQSYGTGGTLWFSLALDPSGAAFWAGDEATGTVKEFGLDGTQLATFTTGTPTAAGLAIAP
jgi:hypothetical protein